MTQQLDKIVELQAAKDALERAERELELPDWMTELHAEHSARLAEIAAYEQAAEDATLARRRAELESAEAEERLKHFREQISLVRTQREYSALLQEIDTVKSEIKRLEEQALSGIEAYDDAVEQLDKQRADFRELDERYAEALERREQEKPGVEQQAETLRAQIAEVEQSLPRNLLALFERIYERQEGTATTPLRQASSASSGDQLWHCAACNYRVRLQVVSEIKLKGALVQCDGCKRFLYVEDEA